MGLGILLIPFLISKLGKEAFGIAVLAESTIIFFEVISLSIRQALSRYVTFSLAQKNDEDLRKYLATGKCVLWVGAVLVLVIGCVISIQFENIFTVPVILENDSKWLFGLLTLSFCVTIPNMVYWAVLYANQRMDIINMATSVGLVVRAMSIFVLFSVLPLHLISLKTYGVIYLLMRLFENYYVYFWHKKVMPGLIIRWQDSSLKYVRSILSYSGHTAIDRVSSLLYENTANVLINIFWGPAYNSIYAVSLKFPKLLNRLFKETAWMLSPTLTELAANNDKVRFEKLYSIFTKISTIVVTPISLFLIAFSDFLINLWVGPGFESAALLLRIHMVPMLLIIPLAIAGGATNAYAKVKIPSQVALLSAVFNLVIGVFLGKYMGWGLKGIALGSLFAQVFYGGIFLPIYASYVSGILLSRFLLESLIRPLFVALTCVFFIWGGLFIASPNDLKLQIGCSLCGAILYYWFNYRYILNSDEKRYISDSVNLIKTRFSSSRA